MPGFNRSSVEADYVHTIDIIIMQVYSSVGLKVLELKSSTVASGCDSSDGGVLFSYLRDPPLSEVSSRFSSLYKP